MAVDNSGITISVNNISDYFNAGAASNGILVASNSSGWTITDNKFFQTATRTPTAGSLHTAIQIVTSSGGGYTIGSNTIGFASAAGTGNTVYAGGQTTRFYGMDLTLGASPVSNIQGNTINGFTFATTNGAATAGAGIFQGITLRAGTVNIGTTSGNTIGATSGTGAINITSTTSLGYIAGIYATSTGTVSIQNNNVGSINTGGGAGIGYTFAGIQTAGAAGNFTISANTIGSTATANSIAIGLSGTTTAVTTFQGIVNADRGCFHYRQHHSELFVVYFGRWCLVRHRQYGWNRHAQHHDEQHHIRHTFRDGCVCGDIELRGPGHSQYQHERY